MSKGKVLILGLLLLMPVLVFLFLRLFGENKYTLPTYFPKEPTEAVVEGQPYDTVYHQVPDFKLISQEGKTVTAQDLDNHVYVANFFFASCKGICTQMSTQMVRVQDAFRNDEAVKLISFTVDPERDTVETLQRYADMYNADPKKWLFLTGPKAELYKLAQDGFYLPVQEVPGIGDFIHSEKFMLVDNNRHIRGLYDGTDPEDVDRLITELRVLLYEYESSKK